MALIQCSFMSSVLRTQTSISVVIPTLTYDEIAEGREDMYAPGTRFQTLFLLHGYSDDQTGWLRFTTVERYAVSRRLALIIPSVQNSAYADMAHGGRYWTYVTEELPRVARALFPLSDRREDNFVAGLSMGGYGAFKVALRNPDRFAAAASLSGALDVASLLIEPDRRGMFENVFAANDKVAGSDDDLFHLAEIAARSKGRAPKLYQACGTEDFLYARNISFRDHARSLGLDLTYEEGPGAHEWDFWEAYIRRVIDWLPLKREVIK
jgi:putative tributyrin esterase